MNDTNLKNKTIKNSTLFKIFLFIIACIISYNTDYEDLYYTSWKKASYKRQLFSYYHINTRLHNKDRRYYFEPKYYSLPASTDLYEPYLEFPYDDAHMYVLRKWEQLGILSIIDYYELKEATIKSEFGIKSEKFLSCLSWYMPYIIDDNEKKAYETLVYGGDIENMPDKLFLTAVNHIKYVVHRFGTQEDNSLSNWGEDFLEASVTYKADSWMIKRYKNEFSKY